MQVISLRKTPKLLRPAINYFQTKSANEDTKMIYEDCLAHARGLSRMILSAAWICIRGAENREFMRVN